MKQPKVAAGGLLAIGILCLVAAVVPLSRGGAVNFPYLMLAGVFIVLGSFIAHRGVRKDSEPPAT